VLAAGGSWAFVQRNGRTHRAWAIVVGVLLAGHVISSLRAFPDAIAYSNEIAGGPSETHRYFTDSNTDWGQQLKQVKLYVDAHQIHDCWFAYFVTPFIVPPDYGIPCKVLPTYDSDSVKAQYPVPAHISGPVFISAGTLTGFEFGSNVLNPYRDFQARRPVAMIGHGVFVYEGSFAVPLAAALSHVEQSALLLQQGDTHGAVQEAQTAVTLAPDGLQTQIALGDAFSADKQPQEAREAYERALAITKTMEPEGQVTWVPQVEAKLKGL